MNEKITELYVQANKYASEAGFKKYDKAGDVNWQWEDTVFEKFAELIVRECTEVCKPVHAQPYEDMDEFHKGLIEGQDVAIEQIKQHFGVEE